MTEKSYHENEYAARFADVEENLKRIREGIARTAEKSGRRPEDITLLAATKTVPVEVINHAIHLGVRQIGENRVQELCEKFDRLDLEQCGCQFIGHLQTNKVRQLIGKVSMIQSVDSMKLAQEISRQCVQRDTSMDVLVEVNIGREENKSGVDPDGLRGLLEGISALPSLKVRGLMAIPPADASEAETMEFFSKMQQYFVDIGAQKIDNVSMDYLSMGMSADYEQAILAGANMVRVGSALFGARVYK